MKYIGVRNEDVMYDNIESLLDREDLLSVVNLEQQRRMLLDTDEIYEEDKYEPIYCEQCGDKCEDIWYVDEIRIMSHMDFCSAECIEKYIEGHIDVIDEIEQVEDKRCKTCVSYIPQIYQFDDWCKLRNEYTESCDICNKYERK